jgi:tetratricopeptide (TPR) repeat protein
MRTFLALAAALLASVSARAEETPAPAPAAAPAAAPEATKPSAPSAHLAAAQRLYQKLDLDAALAELAQAEAAAKDNDEETVQVLVYRGLIYSDTGKTAEAADQFKRALAIRPWAEVPPETSPRIAKIFSDARKSIWGMASVKPPQKKVRATPNAMPASSTTEAPKADPAVAK